MVEIKKETCIGCGACVRDCPGNALRMTDERAEVIRPCIQCGHCVAICPVNAVAIPEYDMEEVEAYERSTFAIDPVQYLHAVKFRRSIRNYKDIPLERDKVQRILDAGRYTATAKNQQACRFVFVQDRLPEFKELVWKEMPDIIGKLKEAAPDYARAFELFYRKYQRNPDEDTFFFNTPSFLVIAAPNPLDGGLAAANIENMAAAEGAGALYSGYMMRVLEAGVSLKAWLGIEGMPVACCMLLGYPNVRYRRTAPRRKADILWI
ncbi:nitroreductase family protein [Qiania dongpingensis]|uniref:Nitroreductase family protein n=1 Tax=Qiania dongpingensis TaxID=2763669 RepID=A0A7G9G591_9FIRM|nr:nitroreductase family protein [Qiania dongpingensis]QNM05973.1 nitroreductase family protein [Qiania dongpingensis]